MHYRRIHDESELIAGLLEPDTAILSGGTDLLVKIRAGLTAPRVLLDIRDVPTLLGIHRSETSIAIGAAVPESDILASPIVCTELPLLAAALRKLGSVQIRHRGTLGGNLVNASPAADSAIPLLLYNAQLELGGPEGTRELLLETFLLGPGRTALLPGEFVRTIRVPIPAPGYRFFYHKVGKRRALTIAIASIGALMLAKEDRVIDLRLAAGSVAPTPIRLSDAEAVLQDAAPTERALAETVRRAMSSVTPITDIRATAAYRRNVIGDLTARALQMIDP